MSIYSERLEKELKARKLNRRQLSIKTGINYRPIQRWFNDGSYPHIKTLKTVCECLDISADYLLGLSDEKERKHKA